VNAPVQPTLLLMFKARPELRQKLEARWRVVGPFRDPALALASQRDREEIVAVVTLGPTGIGGDLIAALPNLGLIAVYGAGFERVDLAAARARGIRITNGGAGNAACVADTAMALLLAVVMRIPQADSIVRNGEWDSRPARGWTRQPGVGGKRLGVLGLGNIGTRIASRAQAFELEIGYHNRSRRQDVDYPYFSSAVELARWSDYLVVAAPATDATEAIVDRAVLGALGPDGYLVNIARGTLVDEQALTEALISGTIAGAGLDVFAHEPDVPLALRRAPNTVFSPHVGGFSIRSAEALDTLLIGNIEAFVTGASLPTEVHYQAVNPSTTASGRTPERASFG
jgi:hydroxypyruvate reductase